MHRGPDRGERYRQTPMSPGVETEGLTYGRPR